MKCSQHSKLGNKNVITVRLNELARYNYMSHQVSLLPWKLKTCKLFRINSCLNDVSVRMKGTKYSFGREKQYVSIIQFLLTIHFPIKNQKYIHARTSAFYFSQVEIKCKISMQCITLPFSGRVSRKSAELTLWIYSDPGWQISHEASRLAYLA